jgi:hypothetical protein
MVTPKEKRSLAKAEEMINRFVETHPLGRDDFDEQGRMTTEAGLRLTSNLKRALPKKLFRVFEKCVFEKRMNAVMDELVAVVAMERVPSKTGMPTYHRVRDISMEEIKGAWARMEAASRRHRLIHPR